MRAVVAVLEQHPDGLSPSDLVVELARAGLFAADGTFEQVEQSHHVVRRACWALRRRDLVHRAIPETATTTLLGRSARTVWRAGGACIAVRRAFAALRAVEAELAAIEGAP